MSSRPEPPALLPLPERLAYARQTVGGDPLATDLGLVVEEVAEGRAVVSLVPQARHLNAVGRVHGSALYALADQAMAVAANTLERRALIVQAQVNFVDKALPGQKLLATAQVRDLKRSLSLWEVTICDQEGRQVALAQGLGYHVGAG